MVYFEVKIEMDNDNVSPTALKETINKAIKDYPATVTSCLEVPAPPVLRKSN